MHRDVEVSLEFLPTSESGRTTAAHTGYRPQIHYDRHDWDAVHEYPDNEEVLPGQRARAFLAFLSPDAHVGRLTPGKSFTVREGTRIVARGRVEKVCDLEASATQQALRRELDRHYLNLGAVIDARTSDYAGSALSEVRQLRAIARDGTLGDLVDAVREHQRAFEQAVAEGKVDTRTENSMRAVLKAIATPGVSWLTSNLVEIPRRLRDENCSMLGLVLASGFPSFGAAPSSEDLVRYLEANPSLIDDWLRYSEDKRTASGWFFREGKDGWIVGYFPGGPNDIFESRSQGCAAFIQREVADVAQHAG